jgi:hypothetical protein
MEALVDREIASLSEEEQREALRVLHQQRVRELLGQLEQMVRSSTTTAKAEVGEQAASENMEESLAMLRQLEDAALTIPEIHRSTVLELLQVMVRLLELRMWSLAELAELKHLL